jgi:hypothetical protein
MLLRYHRPGFDELALEEHADLIRETCAHINEFVEILHKLMTFLEHGKPSRLVPGDTPYTGECASIQSVQMCRRNRGRPLTSSLESPSTPRTLRREASRERAGPSDGRQEVRSVPFPCQADFLCSRQAYVTTVHKILKMCTGPIVPPP